MKGRISDISYLPVLMYRNVKIEAVARAGHSWDILSKVHPYQLHRYGIENAAPQIYAVGCGDYRASAMRLRRANQSRTTCRALSENVMLRNAVEGGDACTLSAEAHPLPAIWGNE